MVDSTEDLEALRHDVQGLLASTDFVPRCDSWMRGVDRGLTRAIGERGWIGMSWAAEHGGGGRSNLARLVVSEELLRAGAPVAAHWTADRQTGPSVIAHGSPALRDELLPAIRRGEITIGLGISETEAGSDLAAVRTKAVKVDGGWSITGSKIWTTSAHLATHLYVLARTGEGSTRHEGLSEFLIDADTPGVTIRPIHDLIGEHHFNEMVFDGAFAPDDRVLGTIGNGWAQITEQLAFERGGIDRYLSTYPLLAAAVRAARRSPDRAATEQLGALAARLVTLRRLGIEVAAGLDAGRPSPVLAAELKLLGTLFEKDVVETARYVLDVCGSDAADLELLADGITSVPGGSIRGGSTEIMRTVISRQETKGGSATVFSPDLRGVIDDVLAHPVDSAPDPERTWQTVAGLGWPLVGVDEEKGGEGGELADAVELAVGAGRHATPVPLWQTGLAAWTLAEAGLPIDSVRAGATVVVSTETVAPQVPWGTGVTVVVVPGDESCRVAVLEAVSATDVTLAGEPVADVDVSARVVIVEGQAPAALAAAVTAREAVLRSAAILGAIERACALTVEHVSSRHQFGKPLVALQVVAHTVADLALERRKVGAAVAESVDRPEVAAVARAVAARSAGVVATAAHQLHGAMGITREHPLHLSTRRLWAWRDAAGSQRAWEQRLGEIVLGGDRDDALWSLATG
ncbi:MAG: acyl-CoA dehydrogenase protein [Aeromicrobium sp.]|nr:acyl-CoA dehydrogenase protein [Aeromicrobium sp.]